MRNKFTGQGTNIQAEEDEQGDVGREQGVARAISEYIDTSLCWNDLKWFKSVTTMKIVLKGVATWEDVIAAYEAGVDGVVLSNHGGRQLDTARSGIEILSEVIPALNRRYGTQWRDTFEVYVDGGKGGMLLNFMLFEPLSIFSMYTCKLFLMTHFFFGLFFFLDSFFFWTLFFKRHKTWFRYI